MAPYRGHWESQFLTIVYIIAFPGGSVIKNLLAGWVRSLGQEETLE